MIWENSVKKKLRLLVLTLFMASTASFVQADDLNRCRMAVIKANTKAASCVGGALNRGLRGKKSRVSKCEARLARHYEKAAARLDCGASCRTACGADPGQAAALIAELEQSLGFLGDVSTGSFEIVADGLESPRGLACSPPEDSALVYVAEAGRGGSTQDEFYIAADGRPAFVGTTGAVGRIGADLKYERFVEGLPSSAAAEEGVGFLDANGPSDVVFFETGEMAIIMGLASNVNVRDTLTSPGAEKFGTLLDAEGEVIADLAAHEGSRNSDGRLIPAGCGLSGFVGDITSNPFRGRSGASVLVVDPGANAVLSVSESGQIEPVATDFRDQMQDMPDLSDFFPAGQTLCPPNGPGLPPAVPIPAQSVPTSIACPSEDSVDGCVVGELTGLPFAVGSANVYAISADEDDYPVVASGFTTIVDIARADDSSLIVLEYARRGLPGIFGIMPPLGGLYRIDQGIKQQLDGGQLTAPNGLAVCGGYVYVTDRTRIAGGGRVLRMKLE